MTLRKPALHPTARQRALRAIAIFEAVKGLAVLAAAMFEELNTYTAVVYLKKVNHPGPASPARA